MQQSWQSYEISLPVDPFLQRLLCRLPTLAAAAVALWLGLVLDGVHRLTSALPLMTAIIIVLNHDRLHRQPDRLRYSLAQGWRLNLDGEECPVKVLPGGHVSRRWLLLGFRGGDGRRWLVLCVRDHAASFRDWRRLRVLWRTTPQAFG